MKIEQTEKCLLWCPSRRIPDAQHLFSDKYLSIDELVDVMSDHSINIGNNVYIQQLISSRNIQILNSIKRIWMLLVKSKLQEPWYVVFADDNSISRMKKKYKNNHGYMCPLGYFKLRKKYKRMHDEIEELEDTVDKLRDLSDTSGVPIITAQQVRQASPADKDSTETGRVYNEKIEENVSNKKLEHSLQEVIYHWEPCIDTIGNFAIYCDGFSLPSYIMYEEMDISFYNFLWLIEHFGIRYKNYIPELTKNDSGVFSIQFAKPTACISSSRNVAILNVLSRYGYWVGLIGNLTYAGGNVHIIVAEDETSAKDIYNTTILDDYEFTAIDYELTAILGRFISL